MHLPIAATADASGAARAIAMDLLVIASALTFDFSFKQTKVPVKLCSHF
jgi:hypothetical protein